MTKIKLRLDRGNHTARILWDDNWEEYIVVFYHLGKRLPESTTYHTDNFDDARETAKAELERMEGKND